MEKRKHPEHTRFEYERKGKVKSVRMTNEQYEAIKRNAEKNKQTMSSYMAIVASKPNNGLTPALLAQLQNFVNECCKVVEQNAPEAVEEMQKEMNKAWLMLT